MKKKQYTYNGTNYDSKEEIDFAKWIEEADKAGFIKEYEYQPESFLLVPRKTIPATVQLKTKVKIIEKFFLNPLTYQADWKIEFNESFNRKFPDHGLIGFQDNIYTIDIKGGYNYQDAYRRLSIYQKLVYDRYGIFVNMVIPEKFFQKTFCPQSAYFMSNRKVLTARKVYSNCKLLREIV
jgi:hypothetical protein